jgi:ABC-2 type transport system permease protein
VDAAAVTGLAVWQFGVPLRGSFFVLMGLTLLFLLTTLGLGLLVSTLVRTQQQAMVTSVYVLMVPMIYLSGLIFPVENMPSIIQKATVVIPLKYYTHIIRGVFLKGSGLDVLWPDAAALLLIGATVLVGASLRFRKSLD